MTDDTTLSPSEIPAPDDDELDPDVRNDPVPEPAEPEPEDDAETSPEPPTTTEGNGT